MTTVGGLLEVLPVVKARKNYFSVVKINTRPTRAEQMQDFVDCWSRDAGQVDSRVGLSRAPSSCLRASKNANSKLWLSNRPPLNFLDKEHHQRIKNNINEFIPRVLSPGQERTLGTSSLFRISLNLILLFCLLIHVCLTTIFLMNVGKSKPEGFWEWIRVN